MGKDVVLKTDSTAIASYTSSAAGIVTAAAQTVVAAALGLNGGYVGSQVLSRVRVVSGASITATNDVTLIAKGKQEASMPAITITGANVFGGAVSIGEIAGTVTADIASGATISVGGNLAVRAENDVKLGVTALTLTTGTALVAATVAYGDVDVTTSAKVHSGATITTTNTSSVSVTAINKNSFSTGATAIAASGGVAGASVAYSQYKSESEALLGASLGTSADKVQNVTVSAITDTAKNATSASTTVGDNLIFNAGPEGTTVSTLLSQIFGKLSSASSSVPVKAGSAIAIADSSLSAKASIAGDTVPAAPTIHASGNVVVASRQYDFGVRLIADSSVNSKSKDPTAAQPEAQVSLSFGIGVGNFSHNSTAFIGSGVTVNAGRIGVAATNEMPISNTWTNWAGLAEAISHINGNLGVVNNIMTTYANASSQSSELGLAGSVSYFRVANDTSAYVASGATLNQTIVGGAWQTTLTNGYDQDWSRGVSVIADTTIHSIDGGGNFGLTGGVNGGAGSAAGGTLITSGRTSRTVAAIADGATITAASLAVTATASDKMFLVVTSSGKSKGVALNGMVGLASLNNQTLASISNRALVTADLVDVRAEQFVSMFSIGGAFVLAGGSAFGVSIGRIDATTVTRAYIGDNSDDLSDDRLGGAGTTLGRIRTDSLTVQAATTGRLTAASIAAAVVDDSQGMTLVTDDPFFAAASASSAAGGGGKPSFALAGSAAVASTQLGTSAWIDGASIEKKTTALSTVARALNSTIIEIGSGSAALNLGLQGGSSATLAGAIAFAKLDNSTDARISHSTLTDVGDTRVQAIAGGRVTAVGLGIAGAVEGTGAAAISAALGLVTNRVSASISDSTLLAASNAANLVTVNAYQTTDIGIGGGAAYFGAKTGVGLAITYAEIRDPSGQDAVSAKVTRSRIEAVDGLVVTASSASRIISSAISAGIGGNGLSGSLVFNSVTPTVRASIDDDSTLPPTITLSGDVVVIADGSRDSALDAIITGRQLFAGTDTSQIDFTGAVTNAGAANPTGASILAIAGAVQGGDNNIGVALLSNRIAQSHIATIQGARITTTGDVIVRAQDGAIITGVAVGLGVATGKFAGVASVTLQSIDNVVRAGVSGATAIVTARDISVIGSATSLIRGTAGSLGLSLGQAAVGLSIVDNSIDSEVAATVEDARLRASGDVVATASSDSRITTLAIGIAIAQKAGLAGSVATSSIGTNVAATVKRADIIAENNIGVIATNHDRIAVSAGALGAAGGSPSVAGGLSIVNNTIGGSTVASVSENSTVDARVTGTGSLAISSGAMVTAPDLSTPTGPSTTFPELAIATRNVRGLAVVATSRQAVMANAVTAGIAVYPLSGAVGYVTIRNSLGGETLASIDSSTIDTRLNAGQNPTAIVVDAASHSYAGSYVVVGAIGGVAGAGADAHTMLKRRTSASLNNSITGTISTSQAGLGGVGAVQVAATSSQSSTGQTIGFSVGGLGAAASGLVNSFEAVTTASLDQGLLNAASVRVTADSTNGFYGVAGVGAAGGVALGSAFVVARSQNTTLATIGGGANVTTLNIFGTLNVLATNTNRFTALAAGGAAAGIASVAGMVNLIDVANTTRAGLYGVNSLQRRTSIQELAGQTIDASLNIIARETTTITPKTGVASIGGSGIGAGSATNVASLDSSVLADLANSTVNTTGAVVVQAISDRHVDANAFTVGQGGSLGLGAAVNVISVGTGAPSGADLNIGGNGTLSRVNQLTTVDPGFTLSTSGLAAYRTLPGVNAAGHTDDQLRAAANTEYLALIQNGVVVNGVLTLTSSGIDALRANAATALAQTSPTDQQVRDYAATRYTALKAANLQYVIGDAGLNSYRQVLEVTTPNLTDAQVKIAANDAFATLLAYGTSINGLYSLSGTGGGQAVYQDAANAELGRTATFSEVSSYAASQYAWFTSNRARTATPSAISATALLDSSGAQTGATALGGSIAAASVSVTSTSKTSTENVALGIGVGGVGVGAALGYTTVADAVSARLDQMTVTTGSVTVNASAIDGAAGAASRVDVEAGAGAGTAAAGAAVAKGSVANTITARLGGTLTVTGATTVSASTTQGSRADALGAAVGGGALGVSLASSSLTGTAKADLAANATLSGGTSLAVTASSNGISYASATAGAGGLLVAGTGADARASDTTRVEAHLGDNASVNVGAGAITVSATATPDAKAAAYGVSVTGGLAVGVAISRATVNQTVIAAMDGGAAAQRALTAGTLSILATSNITGTPVTSIGGSPGATSEFSRGSTGAAAWSFAGSGAYYASATGSDAGASTTSTVTASAGNNVRLPNAVVAITATNTTRQIASSTGFSIAGKYSVGAVLADARSTATTSATLGDDAQMGGNAASSFSLTATGSDTQIAKAVSGSGGLIAGAGASADTANTAAVTARVGARAQIGANTILVSATHTDSYANLVDATQAAAVGASASLASHNATSNVLVDIGASVVFSAIGNGTRGCYVTTCLQGIELESRNIFRQLALGDTISAGAGGGINGVGAKSTTGIDGTSKVLVGNNASFASGSNAISSPGPIAMQAITELAADDTVTLTTGGLLQGAGVTSQYRADTDNEVTLGASSVLTSAGTINIGTYTTATVKTSAFVSTSGLAAVGVAEADTNIRTDQVITIGANSTLTALDNINVTAGRDASGLAITGIHGDASAVGYVRGLIAVPDADAATDLQNHAVLNVHTGSALLSAQNVTLGAYNGTVTPKAHGAGHGFQLFLIPVTQRDESPGSLATSTVAMNGRAVGGVFHQQEIIIGCGAGGLSICDLNAVPTVYINAGSAPVTVTRDDAFNAAAYVYANYTTTNGTIDDTAVADTLVGGIASGLVRAYRISQLYAAGGNVYVNGDTIQGNGTLTANGGPTIKVVNNSSAYLILDGGAYIPDLSTGQILFTGAAQGQSGLTRTSVNANASPSIVIDNAYTRSDVGNFGPALLIADDITNLGGLVSINNTKGSFGFSGQRIDSLQFNVTVPEGAVAIASNGPNGMYNAGASPQAEWGHAITYPGATPGSPSQTYVINDTINAIGNTLYFGSGASLNYNLYHRIEDSANPALRFSTILYGNCIGYGSTGFNCVGGYHFGNGINFALIPTVPKYRESNTVQAQGGGSQIYGAQVAIKASVININASIEAGRATNQSVVLSAGLAAGLQGFRSNYQSGFSSGSPIIDVSEYFLTRDHVSTQNAGDRAIKVFYDYRSGELSVSDVNASSGGGSVLLDGQIISTNQLGKIKINGGFGHVNIVNDSGVSLVTNRINTGTAAGANASTSKITIVDRLITSGNNTTVYAYTPGAGIAVYKSMNGAQPILSGANATPRFATIAGDSTSYDVKDGTRYEWTQQLFVYKDNLVSGDPNQQGVWRYSSGSANNPWVYVAGPATGIWGDNTSSGPDYWTQSTTPQGRLTHNQFHAISNPVFFQTLRGGVTEVSNAQQFYDGCNGQNPSFCSRDFQQVPGSTASTYWNYNHVRAAWLQVTSSVRADYDFGISFEGNASGLINITSNSNIGQRGNIINPTGATTITASSGSVSQLSQVSILSNHLTLYGRDSVGGAGYEIKASLTSGAAVAAYSGAGGIHLNIDSDAKIWRLNADLDAASGRYGDINVRATGGLEVASWADPNYTHALGNNITITSRDGAVGGSNMPLRIQAMATTLANGSQTGGVVNIAAQGDIGIRQLSGNLRVGQIASTGGNVRVDVVGGTLKAANAQTAAQSLSTQQLATISSKLKLTQATGADAAAQASVASFERNVTQTYTLYSSLIRNGNVTNGVFTLDAAATALYQPLADAAGMSVTDYVADRYANYASVFEKAYGAGWSSQARFQEATLESNFTFTTASPGATSGLASSITANSVWQTGQLVAAIDQAALQPASGVVGNGTPIIIGRDVSLTIGGSIGSLAPDVEVSLDAIRNGTLDATQLQALAVATTPGSVKLVGTNGSGQRVAVTSLGTVPDGVTLTSVDIAQTAPLFISATGTFSGSAQGDIYLQATTAGQAGGGSLNLGRVTATRHINLQAPQAITVATAPSSTTPLNPVQIEAGGDLTLTAAGGGIGAAATPLTYQIGGRLISASAGAGDAYLVKPTGNAEIGRIFAQGVASLTANAGSISGYLPGVAISAQTIVLNASGNVGSQAAPFAVQSASDGEISGQIGGSGWISTPTLASQTAIAQRIGALTAAGSLTLSADAELRVLRSLNATTGALSATAGAIVMETGATATAAGRLTLASATDVTLGRITSALVAPQGTASIAVTAAGAIFGNAGVVNLGAAQVGGVIALNAGTGIGTTLDAVSFAAPSLSARSLQGDVNLRTASTTHITALTADLGAATIAADGALTVDALTSGGAASAISTASTLILTTLNAGGTTNLSAAGLVSIGSAATTAGDLVIASTGAGTTAVTLPAAGALSLTAPGAIDVTTANSGTTTQATSSAATLSITALTAGGTATLAGRNGVTLGSAMTTAGDLTIGSSHAGITAATLNAGGAASLTAAGAIGVTTSLTSSNGATVTSTGSTVNLAAILAGGTTSLAGSGAVTLGTARTSSGDLSVSSITAGIGATTLNVAGALTLTAPGAIDVTTATSGATTQASSSAATLSISTLTSGNTTTLAGRTGVTLGSAATTAGDLTVGSSHAGITAATLNAGGAASLTAAGAISVTTSLTSSNGATVTSTGSTVNIAALLAGGTATLAGRNGVTLGSATTTLGDLTIGSSHAVIAAATLIAAGAAALDAAGAIDVTTLTSGGTSGVSSSASTIAITSLGAGATATLTAAGQIMLGQAHTTTGDLIANSTGAGITGTTLTAARAANLSGTQNIAVTSLTSGGTSTVQSSTGAIDLTALNVGGTAQVIGATAVSLGTATTTAGDLRVISAGGAITATRLTSAGGVEATAPGAVTIGVLTSGGAVDATSNGGALRIDTLSAGQIATLVGSTGITLDSAETLTGSLVASASASAGGIQARSLRSADQLTLTARDLIALTEATSANEASIVSTTGIVRATTVRSGATMTVEGAGGVDLQSALATTGDVVLRSSNAGLALGAVTAARDMALLAQGTITANSLVAWRDLSATSLGSTLAIQAFSAGRDISLSANGAIALDAAEAGRNLSVTSGAAGITLRSARAGATIGLDAAGLLTVRSLRSGEAATLSGGAVSIGELIAGDTATLRGVGAVSLGSVSTLLGDIAIASTAGRIDATSLDAAGALALQAAATVQIGTARSGGAAGFVSTAGDVSVMRLIAGRDGRLVADGAVRLVDGGSGGSLTLVSANSLVSIGTATAGSDVSVTAQSIVFGTLDAGRDARLASASAIDGDSIVATQTLTALAGASGAGSIRIAVGAARNSAFTAPDEVRLGRYGAGDSIVILGDTIVSNIVQLAGASGRPLDLTIAGSRGRTAEQVTLSVDAASFRTTRFETVDGALTTTSLRFDLLQAFVPGALRLDAPGLRLFANNRSPAPLTGFDVQLYQRDRPFFVSLNGGSLTTNAMIIRFDSDQISIPGGNGGEPEVSMARDMPRLGASMLTGPSFGETARSFVLDETGRWRSNDPETTASVGGGVGTRVNLVGGGEQP